MSILGDVLAEGFQLKAQLIRAKWNLAIMSIIIWFGFLSEFNCKIGSVYGEKKDTPNE